MTPEEVQQLLESTGAVRRGHFQLSSGLHSPVYVQCARLLEHPVHTARVADALAQLFNETGVDVVAAPALGGIVLGYELARQLGARSVFVERDPGGKLALRRFALNKGDRVLVAEDVLTTGDSTSETIAVVRRAGGAVIGVAAVLDRSGGGVKVDVPLRTLWSEKLDTYEPKDCPLCKAGKPVEKPGSRPNKKEA